MNKFFTRTPIQTLSYKLDLKLNLLQPLFVYVNNVFVIVTVIKINDFLSLP